MQVNSEIIPLWNDHSNTTAFFYEKVVNAQNRQKLKLPENVEFYIVNLLCEFIRVKPNETGNPQEDCLALILKQALESSQFEQIHLFKQLGDTALYFSGFFQNYFNNKSFGVGYYVSMGETAYSQLATLTRKKSFSDGGVAKVYQDMSLSFIKAVDILCDVSENMGAIKTRRDTLSLYTAWLETASTKLEKDLEDRGIQPIKLAKTPLQ